MICYSATIWHHLYSIPSSSQNCQTCHNLHQRENWTLCGNISNFAWNIVIRVKSSFGSQLTLIPIFQVKAKCLLFCGDSFHYVLSKNCLLYLRKCEIQLSKSEPNIDYWITIKFSLPYNFWACHSNTVDHRSEDSIPLYINLFDVADPLLPWLSESICLRYQFLSSMHTLNISEDSSWNRSITSCYKHGLVIW